MAKRTSSPLDPRAAAFTAFQEAADDYEKARAQSTALHEQAAALEAEAKSLQEQATLGIDRALLQLARTRSELGSLMAGVLSVWDSERADKLLKSALVVDGLKQA